MRPPRHRFSDEVRSTTRSMASRMVRDGTVPATAEELDAWVAAAPDERDSLVRGGYGRDFTPDDLLPLLHVFVEKLQGPSRPAAPAKPASRNRLLLALLVLVAVVVLAALLVASAPGRAPVP